MQNAVQTNKFYILCIKSSLYRPTYIVYAYNTASVPLALRR